MRLLSEICSEAAIVRWSQETPDMPTWEQAHQRMLADGKLSHVKHPSPLQAAGRTAPEGMAAGFTPPYASPPENGLRRDQTEKIVYAVGYAYRVHYFSCYL